MKSQKPKRIRAEIRGEDPSGQAIIDYGPLDSPEACMRGIRAAVRAIGAGRDPKFNHTRAIGGIKAIMWGFFQVKGLELKGLNMDGSAPEVRVTLNDYAGSHEEMVAQLKTKDEHIAALEAQNAVLMQARERPRPPRPHMN